MCVALVSSFTLLKLFEQKLDERILDKVLISRANGLSKLFYESATSLFGYSITKSPLFSERLQKIGKYIPASLEEFRQSAVLTPRQKMLKEAIADGATDGLKQVTDAMLFVTSKQAELGETGARHSNKNIEDYADQLSEVTQKFEKEELAESVPPEIATLKLSTVCSSVGAFLLGFVLLVMLSFHLAQLSSQRALSRATFVIFLRGGILVFVPLLILTFSLSVLMELIFTLDNHVKDQSRKTALIVHANALSKLSYDAGVDMGGYSVSKSNLFIARFEKTLAEIPQEISELRKLAEGNTKQMEQIGEIEQIVTDQVKILKEARADLDNDRVDVAQFRAKHVYRNTRLLADKMQDRLSELTADARNDEQLKQSIQASERVQSLLICSVAAGILLGLVLSMLYARSFSKTLSRSR